MERLTNSDVINCLLDLQEIAKSEQEYQDMEARFMVEFNGGDMIIEDCLE